MLQNLSKLGPLVSNLKSRAVIRFSGEDTTKFLQGLITNDMHRFSNHLPEEVVFPTPNLPSVAVPPMYAAILNPHGRFMYDLFLYRPPRPDEKLDRTGSGPGQGSGSPFELLADVSASALDEMLQMFKKYRLRSKVEIENVTKYFTCWQRFGGDIAEKSKDVEEPEAAGVGWGSGTDPSAMSSSQGDNDGFQWFKDPRLECLGFRGIFPSDKPPPLVEADKETDERNFLLWRIENGVAEGSTEIPKGEAIPLEYNLAGLNAFSFDKGCYVGQEFIARTHNMGIIRKRLLPIVFLDENGKGAEYEIAPGTVVTDHISGKRVGFVTVSVGSRGLGLMRLDDAFKETRKLTLEGHSGSKVAVTKPKWWPPDWYPNPTSGKAG